MSVAKFRFLRLATIFRDGAAAILAAGARLLDDRSLRLDQADGLKDFVGRPGDEQLRLLVVQQGEHLAVILQFVAQGFDQQSDAFNHLSKCFLTAAVLTGVRLLSMGAVGCGKTWWDNWAVRLLARPSPPPRVIVSAIWLLIMSL